MAIPIFIQGHCFHVDLHDLDTTGADVVFGISWMKSLGRVLTNYSTMTVEFLHNGIHTIQHTENLFKTKPPNGKRMKKLLENSSITSMCQFQLFTPFETTSSTSLPSSIVDLLKQLESVFQELT